ncbi:MAG: hypothetical protein P8Y12_10800 [Gammaproteobacteria bacterium]
MSKVRVQGKQKSLANEVYIMNCRRVHIITLLTLTTLAITPATAAKVYKCDGPDGPIYSDRKCGSEAVNVEIQESSGLSGVTEQDISDLAEINKKKFIPWKILDIGIGMEIVSGTVITQTFFQTDHNQPLLQLNHGQLLFPQEHPKNETINNWGQSRIQVSCKFPFLAGY